MIRAIFVHHIGGRGVGGALINPKDRALNRVVPDSVYEKLGEKLVAIWLFDNFSCLLFLHHTFVEGRIFSGVLRSGFSQKKAASSR